LVAVLRRQLRGAADLRVLVRRLGVLDHDGHPGLAVQVLLLAPVNGRGEEDLVTVRFTHIGESCGLPSGWIVPTTMKTGSCSRALRRSDRTAADMGTSGTWVTGGSPGTLACPQLTRTTSAVAIAISPSSRPGKPRPSVVAPDTEIGAPAASERIF